MQRLAWVAIILATLIPYDPEMALRYQEMELYYDIRDISCRILVYDPPNCLNPLR